MADEEITVEIEKAPPPSTTDGAAAAAVTAAATDPVADLKAQIEHIEAESAREREAKLHAQRQAQTEQQARIAAEQERDATRGEIVDTRASAIEQGLASAQSATDAARTKIKTAMEAGNWEAVADAQVELADARADFKRFTEAKNDIEVQRQTPQRTETRQAPSAPADPLEAFLAQRSPATAAWLRSHPDEAKALAYNDTRRSAKINAAHNDALAEGHGLDSPEYFAHVEKFLGLTKAPAKTNGAANGAANGGAQQQRRAAGSAPVAPVEASAGPTTGGQVVRLSQAEAAAATDGTHVWNYSDPSGKNRFKKGDPIGITEFARRKAAMQAAGLYDKTLTAQ